MIFETIFDNVRPMSTDWKDIWTTIKEWDAQGRKMALATVAKTWGSSPRPVGSHLIIDQDGHMQGSVSGGCIDSVVVASAQKTILTGVGEYLIFEVATDRAWEVGLSCGGEVHILMEAITDIDKKTEYLLDGDDSEVKKLVSETEMPGGEVFTHIYKPPLELIVVGAVHISQSLVKMAKALNIKTTLIDPRSAYANAERFPGVDFLTDWPDEALEKMTISPSTAIVTLSHDPKLDDPALEIAVRSNAFYVAALGSKKTHKDRVERLRDKGFTDAEIARIHGPAGLDIGSIEPAEIALSILSQLITIHRKTDQ